ncbi:MAG: hypothetical protein FWF34_01615 [Alphaproteobacteria bacterium]|nr:hypothetical protein [Alphaproteobacteria bacterium]MCL2889935.1 hypothetical protein [Alphaproteobacteria bacterium]
MKIYDITFAEFQSGFTDLRALKNAVFVGDLEFPKSNVSSLSDLFLEWFLLDSSYEKSVKDFLTAESLDDIINESDFYDILCEDATISDDFCLLLSKRLPFAVTQIIKFARRVYKKHRFAREIAPSSELLLDKILTEMEKHRAINKEKSKESDANYREKHRERIKANNARYRENNRERLKEINARYREKNKEKIKENEARYRANHPDKVKESARRYRKKNWETIKEKQEKYRNENPEIFRKSSAKYRAKNPDKITESARLYREKYPDRIKESTKNYRENNREKTRESTRQYRLRNLEKVKQKNIKWREDNKERVRELNAEYLKNNREALNEKRRARYAKKKLGGVIASLLAAHQKCGR